MDMQIDLLGNGIVIKWDMLKWEMEKKGPYVSIENHWNEENYDYDMILFSFNGYGYKHEKMRAFKGSWIVDFSLFISGIQHILNRSKYTNEDIINLIKEWIKKEL